MARAFRDVLGEHGAASAAECSEDFSAFPAAPEVPYTYWGIGGIDPDLVQAATAEGSWPTALSVRCGYQCDASARAPAGAGLEVR